LYFPLNAVRWRTPPRDIAALVTESGKDRFEARLFHFGTTPRSFDAELLMLAPGQYRTTVTEAASRRQRQDSSQPLTAGARRINLFITPNTEYILRIERETRPGWIGGSSRPSDGGLPR
jgi:hypothetical protein